MCPFYALDPRARCKDDDKKENQRMTIKKAGVWLNITPADKDNSVLIKNPLKVCQFEFGFFISLKLFFIGKIF